MRPACLPIFAWALAAALTSGMLRAESPVAAPVLEGSEAAADAQPCTVDEAAMQAAAAEAPPSPGIPTIAFKDAVHVLGAPLHWAGKDWLAFSGAAASVVAIGFAADNAARDSVRDHHSRALDDVTRIVEPFGAEYSWAVIGVYGIAGFAFRDADARDIAVDSAMASILAGGIISPILKQVVGRDRPNQGLGTTSLHPFSGATSFPSGHATQAFAVASVISAHSDKVWVSVTAYTLAGLVGFSRIYHDAHWSSDVAAGAVIGTAVGRGLVAFNRKLREGNSRVRVAFAPFVREHERGAGIVIAY